MSLFFRWRYFIRNFFSRLSERKHVETVPEMLFQDFDGHPVFLSDFIRGKKGAVLWMTNLCETCQEKIPFAQKLHQSYGSKVPFIAVSVLGKDKTTPKAVVLRHAPSFPLLLDPEDEIGQTLGFVHPSGACPLRNLLVIDEKRRIRFKHHLSAVPEKNLIDALEEIAHDGSN